MTQTQRILDAFQAKPDLMVYELTAPYPQGLGISQYNARIKELREKGHQIINVVPGHFRYVKGEDMINQNSQAYQKWQRMGEYVKGKRAKPTYTNLSLEELKVKQQTAQEWLKANQGHKNYDEALSRYEAICDEISLLNGDWLK
jgi:hypothetical protein